MSDDEAAEPGAGLAGQWDETPEEIIGLYDTWSVGGYDDDVAAWGYEAPERIATQVAAAVGADGEVLDAGCGTGRVGVALRAAGVEHVVGGDFSPTSVEAARARGVYDEVDHLDLNGRLEFDDDRFAAAVSVGVFTYLTDIAATIRELLRVTRPGGIVVFTQRTDLWDDRDFDGILEASSDAGECTVDLSEPRPYLPGHPEFGDEIGVIDVTLTKPEPT